MKRRLILCGFVCFLVLINFSCTDTNKYRVIDNLIGQWSLDSISVPINRYQKFQNHKTITFLNKTDFIYEWITDDVGGKFIGKYFILDNPKRGLLTLTFIPDIEIIGADTIRPSYINMDILNSDRKRLQLIDETEWISRGSLPSTKFNKCYIYKKK